MLLGTHHLSVAKLREPHNSIPANLLLAEPMYLAGYIERMGTGTGDVIRWCKEARLKAPEFIQEEIFKIILWRKNTEESENTGQPTGQPTIEQIDDELSLIKKIISVMSEELVKRSDIQEALGLKHREYFMDNYLNPAINLGYIEMTYPDSPNHPQRRYRLTEKGIILKIQTNSNPKVEKRL